jgi:signal peptidase I
MQILIHPKGKEVITKSWFDTLWIAGPGILLFLALKYLCPINVVPSASMEPTIDEGSKVLVDQVSYRLGESPQRGDVVVFDSGYRYGLGDSEPIRFLKRVVALPGDTVEIASGQLMINDVLVEEDYATIATVDYAQFDVPAGHYFLLGDNRDDSHDSRFLGPIPQEAIQGQAIRIVSLDEFPSSPTRTNAFLHVAD